MWSQMSVTLVKPDVLQTSAHVGPLLRVPLQHLGYELPQSAAVAVEGRRERQWRLPDVLDRFVVVLRLEGRAPAGQSVEEHAGRPHVDALPVAAREHLGGAVVERAGDGPHLGEDAPPADAPRDAEVDELYGAEDGVVEDVLGFDVSVDDVLLVEVGERHQHLVHHSAEVGLLDEVRLRQRGRLCEFHDEVSRVLLHVEIEAFVGEDVGVLQSLEDQEVGLESGDVFVLEHEGFHCEVLVGLPFDAAVDYSV